MNDQLNWHRINNNDFDEVKALDDICFEYKDLDIIKKVEPERGQIYSLYSQENDMIIGYSVYGQFFNDGWNGRAYIMRIGTHPDYRNKGYAILMLEYIIQDLLCRENICPAIFCDIRQSNVASMNLFTKVGFNLYQVRDEVYPDGELSNCMIYHLLHFQNSSLKAGDIENVK